MLRGFLARIVEQEKITTVSFADLCSSCVYGILWNAFPAVEGEDTVHEAILAKFS